MREWPRSIQERRVWVGGRCSPGRVRPPPAITGANPATPRADRCCAAARVPMLPAAPRGARRGPLQIRKNPPLLPWKEESEHPVRHQRVQKLSDTQPRHLEDGTEGATPLNRPKCMLPSCQPETLKPGV